MDFISNLIKRPISLVLNDTSATLDLYPISASLPNTPSVLDNKKDLENIKNEEQIQNQKQKTIFNQDKINNHNPLSMSSSYNEDNMTDFIGVPEDLLDEFKDILPPPPLSLQNSYHLTQSLLDMDNTDSLSITPPPPPFPLQLDKEQSLSPSMKVSQTIDELLLEISDNLQQAGLNDDVLAIASPPNKSELSPLSAKAALNNSKPLATPSSASNKHLYESKMNTMAAGSADSMVIANNSSFHQFDNDPKEFEAEDHKQHQENGHHLNNSDVNKSTNKFTGLTEFDETKIPELSGDLNSNIEEQYNVTFEKCFMPTFKTQQGPTASDKLKVDQNHLPLPNEMDAVSSDNEAFVDCNDEKDPLETNCAEPDVTTEIESFLSAANKTLNSSFNNTMENIAEITIEAENQPLKYINQNEVAEQHENQPKQSMDEEEPMDVDMNDTMEVIHNTSNNIQHVEKVLQHAENILQHLEDKKTLTEGNNTESVTDFVEKQNELSKTASEINTPLEGQALDIEQTKHELSLNKSIELPANESKNLNMECVIDSVKRDVVQEENKNKELEPAKDISNDNPNTTLESINSSNVSNSSAKLAVDSKNETKLNSTLNLSSSMNSQKNSPPNSPTFPIKTAQIAGFPRSPKAAAENSTKTPFLEKSDYLEAAEERSPTNLNGKFIESSSDSIANNVDGSFEDIATKPENENNKCLNLEVKTMKSASEEPKGNNAELKNKRYTFSMDTPSEDKEAEEKRRAFSVKSNETGLNSIMQFPSEDKTDEVKSMKSATEEPEGNNIELNSMDTPTEDKKTEEKRRTFSVNSNETGLNSIMQFPSEDKTDESVSKSRRTFNLPSKTTEQADEPMEVEETVPQNITVCMSANVEQISEPSAAQKISQPSQQTSQARTQTPPPISIQLNGHLTPPLSIQPNSQSPPLPTTHPIFTSPPILTVPRMFKKPSTPNIQTVTQTSHPTMSKNKAQIQTTPQVAPESTFQAVKIKEEQMSPLSNESTCPSFASQPLSTLIQKRPSIRDARRASAAAADTLSVKELSNIKVKDEKDVFVEKLTPSPVEDLFTAVSATSTTLTNSSGFSEFDQTSSTSSLAMNAGEQQIISQQFEEEFSSGNNNLILNPSDFDYLLTRGNNNVPVDRSSLLLKFDPLLGVPVPVYQGQQQHQHLQIPTNNNSSSLSPPLEEDEHNNCNSSLVTDTTTRASAKLLKEKSQQTKLEQQVQQNKRQLPQEAKKNATMSVDVIKDMSLDNDCNKTYENSNSTQSDVKQNNYKMDELEKKIKNEVLKTDDIEKKLKDAEQREEALIKRITEKDKTIAKMNGVVEAYEKAIAELIADKEQLTQNYEKQLAEVKADRDSNYHHLTSLETTFSDLHVKYEKSKEMTCQLKESEEALQAEKRRTLENLHLQEQRYDKMKNHAMQQLEIANKKLESLTREHAIEITKLKALLKKEEIARSSINEQLAHKTKENEELVKICDELISGQGIS